MNNFFIINNRSKFYEFDMKPVCKGCFNNLPSELRKRLRNAFESMKIEG